jgi:hypothetical protein
VVLGALPLRKLPCLSGFFVLTRLVERATLSMKNRRGTKLLRLDQMELCSFDLMDTYHGEAEPLPRILDKNYPTS